VSVNCLSGNVQRRVTGSSVDSPSSLPSVRRLLEGRRAKGTVEGFPGPLNSTHIPRVQLSSFASLYSCLRRNSNSRAEASSSEAASDRTFEVVAVFTFDRRPQLPLPVVSCSHRSTRGANTTPRLSIWKISIAHQDITSLPLSYRRRMSASGGYCYGDTSFASSAYTADLIH
jgi:hypothetical protein